MSNSSLIPTYLDASSPRGLQRLMLQVNNKLGAQATFFDFGIYKNSKGENRFICWYYVPMSEDIIKEVVSNE